MRPTSSFTRRIICKAHTVVSENLNHDTNFFHPPAEARQRPVQPRRLLPARRQERIRSPRERPYLVHGSYARLGPERGSMLTGLSAPACGSLRASFAKETPKLQSMSYGDAQTLRSVFLAPLPDARLPLPRSHLLRLLARRGLDARDPRPRVRTAKCSQFLPPWLRTCQTRRRRSSAPSCKGVKV